MFTIEKRTAKNGKAYIGIFLNGGKRPAVVNDYGIIASITGISFEGLASIRKNPDVSFCVRYELTEGELPF